MKNLGKIIKKTTGLSVRVFCETELRVPYKTFWARVKQGRLHPTEIFYLVWRTKHSITDLFNKSWHELFILGPGGEITGRVNEIITAMSEDERQQIAPLMGIHPAREESIVEEPVDLPEEKQPEEENALKKLFINTY